MERDQQKGNIMEQAFRRGKTINSFRAIIDKEMLNF